MIRFVGLRLVRLVVTLAIASVAVFFTLYLAPGSPLAALARGRSLSPEQISQINAQYHLNRPVLEQFWDWFTQLLHGNLGVSLLSQEPVSTLLHQRAETSLLLVGYAAVLVLIAGPPLGALFALLGRGWDTGFVTVSSGAAAIPPFVAAVVLTAIFAVNLGWFPVFGDGAGLANRLWHLTLPAICLALAAGAYCGRVARSAVLDEANSEHVDNARSRGLNNSAVVRRHILRNALVPITTSVGISVAGMFAGTVIVEQAFGLDGLGSLLVESIQNHDLVVVQAVVLVLVAAFVVLNALIDGLYPLLDPRISFGRSA